METSKITIEAQIAASKNKTGDYYTNPRHIVHWNFASEDWHCPNASNELVIGGKYLARMAAKNESFAFDFEAVYLSIDPENSFVYEMADGRKVETNFLMQDNDKKVIITFDAETENSLEPQKGGWQAILNNFKKYTESH